MITEQEKNKALLQWLKLHQNNKTLADLLKERGIRSIGICGYRDYGRLVCQERLESGFEIGFILERNYEAMSVIYEEQGVPVIGFEGCGDYEQIETVLLTPDLDDAVIRQGLELAGVKMAVLPLTTLLNE